ncbi:hypothetical protein KM043_003133 [Ampulex compressa]|nr:hypothetical protein KM043_003133 [Ampulex compressa]
MTKRINSSDGFTLRDIMSKDGVTIEIGDEYRREIEEEFSYSSDVYLSNDEMMNVLNMEDFDEDTNKENDSATLILPYGIGFQELKTRMMDLSGDGKIMKLIKESGVGDIVPANSQVSVQYVGYFEYRDEPFDSTYARGQAEKFRLQQGTVIPGLDIGIASMKRNEVAMFVIHPDFAYGELGCPPRIPANEEVAFVVHLMDFLENGSMDIFENLDLEERKTFANVLKRVKATMATAKECFKRQRHKQAIREYRKAAEQLENAALKNDEEEEEMKALASKIYSNLAVCYNNVDMPRQACLFCNKIAVPTAKSRFNHGRALLKMGEYERAMQELLMSNELEPGNAQTFREIQLVNQKQRRYLEMERKIWANCLNGAKGDKQISSFGRASSDMCEAFARDPQILRQPLPEGLTKEEEKCIRERAAALGLSVTTHLRYGKELTFLHKPNY